MAGIPFSFVLGGLTDYQISLLKDGRQIDAKMILTLDDFKLFNYKTGDRIEAEAHTGDRVWCRIINLEKFEREENVILIFTLENEKAGKRTHQ